MSEPRPRLTARVTPAVEAVLERYGASHNELREKIVEAVIAALIDRVPGRGVRTGP